MTKFAERLLELRLEKNLTQKQLGAAAGLSQNAIAQWENDKRRPGADALIALAGYFDVSVDYILGLED